MYLKNVLQLIIKHAHPKWNQVNLTLAMNSIPQQIDCYHSIICHLNVYDIQPERLIIIS